MRLMSRVILTVFASPDINTKHERGWENSRQICNNSQLHNFREFSQPLECLYQAMQTQEKVFHCF